MLLLLRLNNVSLTQVLQRVRFCRVRLVLDQLDTPEPAQTERGDRFVVDQFLRLVFGPHTAPGDEVAGVVYGDCVAGFVSVIFIADVFDLADKVHDIFSFDDQTFCALFLRNDAGCANVLS